MQETTLTFTSGGSRLVGTLTSPSEGRVAAMALLVSGSGPIDRDSNMKRLSIDVMRQVAASLASHGIASYRYDKRGVGESNGDYHRTGFSDNVADAAAALEALRGHMHPGDRTIVIGHSEGALIGLRLAATHPELGGLVMLAGAARTGEEVLRWQASHVADSLPAPVRMLMKVLRQDVARTQQKRFAQLRATTDDIARIQLVKINAKWFREFLDHDPKVDLERVSTPMLAITGAKDIQVDPADLDQMRDLVDAPFTGHVLADVTHLLRRDTGPPSIRTYKKQAKNPVDSELLELVASWIVQTTGVSEEPNHEALNRDRSVEPS